jgi:hypothetical protein
MCSWGRAVGFLLLADSHTYVCRTWGDLAARLVWARKQGYVSAKARLANGDVDRPLLPSEQVPAGRGRPPARAQLLTKAGALDDLLPFRARARASSALRKP